MKRSSPWKGPRLSQLLYTLSLAFLALGLFSLSWAVWPASTDAIQFDIPAGPLPAAPEEQPLDSLSDYSLEIAWPRWIRRGETGTLRLFLADLDHTPPAQGEARATQLVLVEPALYPLRVDPLGGMQANLGDDQELLLTWSVSGGQPGDYPGKLFVSFGFYEDAQDSIVTVPVAVVDIHIRVIDLWGLGSGLAIWFGLVSLVLWGTLFILGRVAAR